MNKHMNILVLFSYGSLYSLDDIPFFYDDIFHGHATKEHIHAAVQTYENFGKADPLGAHTNRIGRALIKRLEEKSGQRWTMFVANHHAKPSIEEVAVMCKDLQPERVVTLHLTPFHSVTGKQAYEKKFQKHFLNDLNPSQLIHIPSFSRHQMFIDVLVDRVDTALHWLREDVREEAEIIFTMHSLPGVPEAHRKTIDQYEQLAQEIAHCTGVKHYHLAYRSGNPHQRWLKPDVLDVIYQREESGVRAIVFVEVLSIIENMEVIQEITKEALHTARALHIQAVQSEYLNDSADFIDALESHLWQHLYTKI